MKHLVLALGLVSLISCGGEKTTKTSMDEAKGFSVLANTATMQWTAYKTTEKKGVKGNFGKINLKEIPTGNSRHEAMSGLSFGIPIASLVTGNKERDGKIKSLFFGVLENTEFITGTFETIEPSQEDINKGHGVIALSMNSITCDLPFDYTIVDNHIDLISSLNVQSWKAGPALESLNKACFDVHKGKDGISKTWEDVSLEASVDLVEK